MRRIPILILLTWLLASCEALPTRPSTRVNAPPASQADRLYQQERFAEAARAYLALAAVGEADRNALRAADAYWMARDEQASRRTLGNIDRGQLSTADRALARLLGVASAQPPATTTTALRALSFAVDLVPENYRVLFHHLRAEALQNNRQSYQSALERVALGQYLSPMQRTENNQRILSSLRSMAIDQIDSLAARHPPADEMHGWLRLVAVSKQARLEGQSVNDAIARWKLDFPNHPGALDSVEQLSGSFGVAFGKASRIALLLPMSGRFGEAGRAVRDGFLAAFFADADREAQVRVYDVGDSAERAALQYDLAVRDGADQIIGPLSKAAVTEMLLKADGNVPVLALNESHDQVPAARGVYQFALLPEHEAASVAERMLADGKLRSVVMVPESDWGNRVADAFVAAYQQRGGEVLTVSRYPSSGADFGPVIKAALGLAASDNRVRDLERLLGLKLEAEAGARHDLDAIFLAARPTQGRLIKPQFEFHNAADVPVYATSAIYAGKPDPDLDKDMNGLRFCDAPWLVGAPGEAPSVELAREYFAAGGTPLRLFGLGLDAYRLLPYLGWLLESPTDIFPGATGELSVDPSGRISRDLGCAEIRRGLAQYLEPPQPFGG